MTGDSEESPVSDYWPQELEFQICRVLPGTSLSSLDDTDIETLIPFIEYIISRNKDKEQEQAQEGVMINGRLYKKVGNFSERI